MRISFESPLRVVVRGAFGRIGLAAVLAATSIHCAAPGECNQYSDCFSGYSCVSGKCVMSSNLSDASGDALADGALFVDAPNSDGETPNDASNDEPSGDDTEGDDASNANARRDLSRRRRARRRRRVKRQRHASDAPPGNRRTFAISGRIGALPGPRGHGTELARDVACSDL